MSLHLDLFAGLGRARVRGSLSQKAGLYYERKVTKWFARRFHFVVTQPRIEVRGRYDAGTRYPDLLAFDKDLFSCLVVEVKHQYSPRAWGQVDDYRRLLEECLPRVKISPLIVCKQALEGVSSAVRFVEESEFGNLSRLRENVFLLSDFALKRDALLGVSTDGPYLGRGPATVVVREPGRTRDRVRVDRGLPRVAVAPEGRRSERDPRSDPGA